jgi:glutamate 5-kinase
MYSTIVVKVGTKVLSHDDGTIEMKIISRVVDEITVLRKKGARVVLVTSGAVGAGRSIASWGANGTTEDRQAYAAIGQVRLMEMYAKAFGKHSAACAQVLVTKEDFRDKHHYENMRVCIERLLARDVVPVVNENDVVSTNELFFTDNDELSGLLASQLNADAVIILTSVDGVLDTDGKTVPRISAQNAAHVARAVTPVKTAFGRGGMLTKFSIARKLAKQGVAVHIVDGRRKDAIVAAVEKKDIGTLFVPELKKASPLKRRIAYSEGLSRGKVYINECAREVITSPDRVASLLPVGIVKVEGDFVRGDVIEVCSQSGAMIGFGVARYGAEEARSLKGMPHAKLLIHYDHLFIL